MLASVYKSTTDLKLLRMKRLTVGHLRRWPHGGFEMTSTISGSPQSNTLISSDHQTGGSSRIIGCGRTYGRPSMTSGAARSTLVDGRGLDRIGLSSKIRSGTLVASLIHILWPTDW